MGSFDCHGGEEGEVARVWIQDDPGCFLKDGRDAHAVLIAFRS